MSAAPPVDLDAAFAALADSTRRAVIRQLLHEPLRAGELARRVAMSPPALSRHLRVLREARLIVEHAAEQDARVRVYEVDLEAFAPVRDWLDEVEAHWHEQLAAFKQYAETPRASEAAPESARRERSSGRKRPATAESAPRERPLAARRRAPRPRRSKS